MTGGDSSARYLYPSLLRAVRYVTPRGPPSSTRGTNSLRDSRSAQRCQGRPQGPPPALSPAVPALSPSPYRMERTPLRSMDAPTAPCPPGPYGPAGGSPVPVGAPRCPHIRGGSKELLCLMARRGPGAISVPPGDAELSPCPQGAEGADLRQRGCRAEAVPKGTPSRPCAWRQGLRLCPEAALKCPCVQ